jgi:hypothetical protein
MEVRQRLKHWVSEIDLSLHPVKRFPGKWSLYEYYFDKEKELFHFTEKDLKQKNACLFLNFINEDEITIETNLDHPFFQNMKTLHWSKHRNFITFIDVANFRNSIEFQFAFDKGNLKLLKRNSFGYIDFFGFFGKSKG